MQRGPCAGPAAGGRGNGASSGLAPAAQRREGQQAPLVLSVRPGPPARAKATAVQGPAVLHAEPRLWRWFDDSDSESSGRQGPSPCAAPNPPQGAAPGGPRAPSTPGGASESLTPTQGEMPGWPSGPTGNHAAGQ
eukprot:9102791-Lingulodinium_polyedra.AAC.1